MDTKEQLVALGELANLEKKLRSGNKTLEERPQEAKAAQADADEAKAAFDDIDRLRHDAEKERRRFESEVAQERDKLRKWENRADAIRGEREHAALQSEIGALKRTIRYLENAQLEKMEELEETAADAEKRQEKAETLATSAKAEWEKVEGELNVIREEIASTERARDALLEKLPAPLVKKYQKLAERRQGQAIGVIRGETCTACSTKVPPQMVLQVYKGTEIHTCQVCQRLLVHEASTRAPDQAAD